MVLSLRATEETGPSGREIESRRGIHRVEGSFKKVSFKHLLVTSKSSHISMYICKWTIYLFQFLIFCCKANRTIEANCAPSSHTMEHFLKRVKNFPSQSCPPVFFIKFLFSATSRQVALSKSKAPKGLSHPFM
jgi:hypothetical protein